jgi:hypothetical protein
MGKLTVVLCKVVLIVVAIIILLEIPLYIDSYGEVKQSSLVISELLVNSSSEAISLRVLFILGDGLGRILEGVS